MKLLPPPVLYLPCLARKTIYPVSMHDNKKHVYFLSEILLYCRLIWCIFVTVLLNLVEKTNDINRYSTVNRDGKIVRIKTSVLIFEIFNYVLEFEKNVFCWQRQIFCVHGKYLKVICLCDVMWICSLISEKITLSISWSSIVKKFLFRK